MDFCKKFLVLFLLITIIGIASALVPTTEPCWIKGTVTGSGVTVEGLTVTAYYQDTNLKSGTIGSDGSYSLNSVGANNDNNVVLKVLGAPFASITFEGFCKTNGDPWVVKDFTVSKQANGVTCSSNTICLSGNCSSGVCAAVPASGSGTGSPGGGTTGGTTGTTPADSTEIIRESSYTEQLTNPDDIRELLENAISEGANLTEEEIQEFIEAAGNGELEIVRELTVTKTVSNGVTSYESKFVLVVKNTSQNNLKEVKIVETIPKEIAEDASEISSIHDFVVLIADPVIEFTIPLLLAGQTIELTYTINENVTQEEFERMPGVLGKGVFAPIDEPTVCPAIWAPVCGVNGTTYGNDCEAMVAGVAIAYNGECVPTEPEPTLTPMDWTPIIIGIIVLLIIIGGVIYFAKKPKKNNKFGFSK